MGLPQQLALQVPTHLARRNPQSWHPQAQRSTQATRPGSQRTMKILARLSLVLIVLVLVLTMFAVELRIANDTLVAIDTQMNSK